MPTIDDLNLITNPSFSDGLTGWDVSNPSGNLPPQAQGGHVSFNAGNESTFGDSIAQTFATTVGHTYSFSLDLFEDNGGRADHTFQIDILSDTGDVLHTLTTTVANDTSQVAGLSFVATSATSSIRITNTTSTSSGSTDGKIDNVRVIDITGDDAIDGTVGDDLIRGGAGDDTINGLGGDDTIRGGSGNDSITDGLGRDIIYGGAGNDIINIENESGVSNQDTVFGGAGDDIVFTGIGNSGSPNAYFGGDGIDTYDLDGLFQGASVHFDLNAGGIIVSGGDVEQQIVGFENFNSADSAGDEQVTGTEGDNVLSTGSGNNSISGLGGNDTIDGGAGNDIIAGGAGIDTLFGRNGDDTFLHGDGEELDNVFGGSGTDTLDLSAEQTNGVNANLDSLALTMTGLGGTVAVEGIEVFIGTQADDTIESGFTQTIDGQGGDDTIIGDFGTQSLIGGAGNDTFIQGDGEFIDNIDGGDGIDTVDLSRENGAENGVDADLGAETFTGTGGTRVLQNVENFIGTQVGDTITGSDGANTIDGDAGDDTLNGGDGDDLLLGGAGNDDLFGGAGNDTLQGGAGNDELSLGDGDDVARGGQGNDEIGGFGTGNKLLFGGRGSDELYSGFGDDTLFGGAGNDNLDGFDGNDILYGGEGNDHFRSSAGTDVMFGGVGDDEFAYFLDTTVTLFGGDGNDRLDLSSQSFHDLSDDTFEGIETLEIFDVDDLVTLKLTASQLFSLDVIDPRLFEETDTFLIDVVGNGVADVDLSGVNITSTPATIAFQFGGDDTGEIITGSNGKDSISGNGGHDTFVQLDGHLINDIDGGAGNDMLDLSAVAGVGTDANLTAETYTGAGGTGILRSVENVIGTQTDDTITGSVGANILSGGAGDDTLIGLGGDDLLFGGAGNDTLIVGPEAGPDDSRVSVNGGTGEDILIIDANAADVALVAGNGVLTIRHGEAEVALRNVETVRFNDADADFDALFALANAPTDGDDILFGTAAADTMSGLQGQDQIFGFGGDDRLSGDQNDDTLTGGSGDDALFGGSGADRLLGGRGQDDILGGTGADTLQGQANADLLSGGDGDDSIFGGSGADDLRGGKNDDALFGGDGRDVLTGGRGQDALRGGGGNDTLTGGGGADTFVFARAVGDDTVTDFADGQDQFVITGGATRFADLDVRQVGDDVVIAWASTTVTVTDTLESQITAADFTFG